MKSEYENIIFDDLDDDEEEFSTQEDAIERVAELEQDIQSIQFEYDSERDEFCEKYEKALRAAGYEEDDIYDKIEDIQINTMTREDLCYYYGDIDDDELDDFMDDDMADYYD